MRPRFGSRQAAPSNFSNGPVGVNVSAFQTLQSVQFEFPYLIAIDTDAMLKQPTSSTQEAPVHFWQSGELVDRVLDQVHDAADQDIQKAIAWLEEISPGESDLAVEPWSLQISKEGLQVHQFPIDNWISEVHFPCYVYQFVPGDTVGWLLDILHEHRGSLRHTLVSYLMRNAGYDQSYKSDGFIKALEREVVTIEAPRGEADDEIPW